MADDAGQIAGPRVSFGTRTWTTVALLFGGTLVLGGVCEENLLYAVGLVLVRIVLFFQYEQTVVDTVGRTWARNRGGLFGRNSQTGSPDKIVGIKVH